MTDGYARQQNKGGQHMSEKEKEQNPALDLLVPKRKFSREEWRTLLEHRLNSLKSHLKYLTLEKLGEEKFLPYTDFFSLNELQKRGISITTKVEVEKGGLFSGKTKKILECQGLFFESPRCDWEQWFYEKCRIERIAWGILRDGTYILINFHHNIKSQYVSNGKHHGSVGDIIKVFIEQTDFATILSYYPDNHLDSGWVGPRHMWWQIGKTIKDYAGKRYDLYRYAKKLQDQFELYDHLLDQTGPQERKKNEKEEASAS